MTTKHSIYPFFLLLTLFLLSSCQSDPTGRTLLRIGNKQYNKGLYNDSESSYLKSIEKGSSTEALYGRGNSSQCLLSSLPSSNVTSTDSVALSSYMSALDQTSGNSIKQSKIYHNMGNLCYQAGLRNQKTQHLDESIKKFSESVEYYKSSLRLNPSDDETRYNLCMAMYMLDKNKKEQEKQNQDQSQNPDKQNQNQQQDQTKDNNKDKSKEDNKDNKDNKDNQSNKEDQKENSSQSDSENKDNKNKDQKDSQKQKDKDKGKDQEQAKNEDKKEKEDGHGENKQNQPSSQNKNNQSSASRAENAPKPEGGIDKKTANQLLNAAQQDENKVQKKIEKAIGMGGSYEKDW